MKERGVFDGRTTEYNGIWGIRIPRIKKVGFGVSVRYSVKLKVDNNGSADKACRARSHTEETFLLLATVFRIRDWHRFFLDIYTL